MAGRVAEFVLLSFLLRVAHVHTSTNACDTSNMKEGETNKTHELGKNEKITMFILPGNDFKGITLHVEQAESTGCVTWFPATYCNTDNNQWAQLRVNVWNEETVILKSGDCKGKCKTSASHGDNMRVRVAVDGSFKVIPNRNKCLAALAKQSKEPQFTCNSTICTGSPSSDATNITTTKEEANSTISTESPSSNATSSHGAKEEAAIPISAIIGSTVAVVVVLVVTVVVVCWMRRHRTVAPGTTVRPLGSMYVLKSSVVYR